MKTVNIHEAKTNLSRLIEAAVNGEPFVIAKAGKPMVKVTMVEEAAPRRLGFLANSVSIPADFDEMGADEIADDFDGLNS